MGVYPSTCDECGAEFIFFSFNMSIIGEHKKTCSQYKNN